MPAGTPIRWSVVGGGYLVPRYGASTVVTKAFTVAPTVALVSPPEGGIERDTPLIVDVTDDESSLVRVVINVRFFDAISGAEVAREVVHDGGGAGKPFGPLYQASSVAPISRGFRFTLVRTGGWPSSPRLRVLAFDTQGEETS